MSIDKKEGKTVQCSRFSAPSPRPGDTHTHRKRENIKKMREVAPKVEEVWRQFEKQIWVHQNQSIIWGKKRKKLSKESVLLLKRGKK